MRLALFLATSVLAASAQELAGRCGACHSEPVSDFQSHPHHAKGLDCDACHGKSAAHREATGHKPPDKIAGPAEQPQVCGACHPAQRTNYESSKHGKLVLARDAGKRAAACTTCHGTHALRSAAAMARQCARCHENLPESCAQPPGVSVSKLLCANCHEKHGLQVAAR